MNKHTFHVVALPHTVTSKEYNACAYTQKVFNFCKMMIDSGHTVYHYGTEGSNVPCTEHITIMTRDVQKQIFGEYDWKSEFFKIEWDPNHKHWQYHNNMAIREIYSRAKRHDFLCLIGGHCQKPIADFFNNLLFTVEYGVGYTGVFSKFRVFESYAQMHKIYAYLRGDSDGHYYDAVIPNYYDPDDFPGVEYPSRDYFLYIGRVIYRKGVTIAAQVTENIGAKLIIAGQGAKQEGNKISSPEVTIIGGNIEYVGYADVKKRAELMANARAVFVPTIYIEPFGGVAVEAMMSGTPVISSDWGAFPETVIHGVTGYRCRTFNDFVWAARNVDKLPGAARIRDYAVANYSIKRIAEMYNHYFDSLYDLTGKGWYNIRDIKNLDWLKRY